MKYKVVTYNMGRIENILHTDSAKEVTREYSKSNTGSVAVRVWMDGKKLPYIKSNSLFGQGYKEHMQYGNGIPKRIIGKVFYAER